MKSKDQRWCEEILDLEKASSCFEVHLNFSFFLWARTEEKESFIACTREEARKDSEASDKLLHLLHISRAHHIDDRLELV